MPAQTNRTILAELTRIVGEQQIFTAPSDRQKYERGWRYGEGEALCVVRPKDKEEVAKVLALCHAHRIPVVPQGGNTGLVGASVPDKSGQQLVLSLERLRQISAIDTINRTVTAGAGVVLDTLNEALQEKGLFLPIDIGSSGSAMLGGLIAANAAGARKGRYGDTRSRVKHLSLVLADGTLLELGGALDQDNGHLHSKDLFIGSQGTLGVIVEATLTLEPLPLQRASAIVVPLSESNITEIREMLERRFASEFIAFEGMADSAARLVAKHHADTPYLLEGDPIKKEEQDFLLLVEVASHKQGSEEPLQAKLEEVLAELFEEGIIATARADKPELFWHVRHCISESIAREGKVIAFDVAVKKNDLPRFRREMTKAIAQRWPQLKTYAFGHEMVGACHYNLVWPKDAGELEETTRTQIRELVYTTAQSLGGTFSAEHGVGPHNRAYYERFTPAAERALAAAIKQALDPNHILNPNVDFS